MRRVTISAVVLLAAVAIARLPPPRLTAGAIDLAEAGEIATYVASNQPVRVRLAGGQRLVRILTNLDLGREAPPGGVPYLIRVRIAEDGRDELFPAVGQPAVDGQGAPALLIPGTAIVPGRTREVAVAREAEGAATVEISLPEPAGARAALRVLVLEERAPTAGKTVVRRLARVRGRPVDASFLAHRWVRASALAPVFSRRLYVLGEAVPRPHDSGPKGEVAGPGLALAYMVTGPGTVRLASTEGHLAGTVRLVDESGGERAQEIDAAEGMPVSLAVGAGLTCVRVEPAAPARVLVRLENGARPLWPASKEVVPTSATAQDWELASPGRPLRWSLVGRRDGPVRLRARLLLGSGVSPPAVAARYRFLDRAGRTLASGALAGPVAPALVDRLDGGPPRAVSEALTGFVWPPRAAARLEVTTAAAATVTVASSGFAPEAPAPRAATRLAHAPADRPRWYRVRADGAEEARVRVAAVLERRAPARPSSQVATLEPRGRHARFALLVPAPSAQVTGPGWHWPVPAGRSLAFTAPGASTQARVRPRLLYLSARGAPALLTVSIDGARVRGALAASRGQMTLLPVRPGRHRLRVEAPAGLRLFVDQPVEGATPYRLVSVHELRPAIQLDFSRRGAARALGLVLYSDRPLGERARLSFTVDGGAPRVARGTLATGVTSGVRALPVATRALAGAMHLQRRAARVFASAPIFLPFGDDAAPGLHRVAVAVSGARGPVFARFFSYGGETAPSRSTFYARRETAGSAR